MFTVFRWVSVFSLLAAVSWAGNWDFRRQGSTWQGPIKFAAPEQLSFTLDPARVPFIGRNELVIELSGEEFQRKDAVYDGSSFLVYAGLGDIEELKEAYENIVSKASADGHLIAFFLDGYFTESHPGMAAVALPKIQDLRDSSDELSTWKRRFEARHGERPSKEFLTNALSAADQAGYLLALAQRFYEFLSDEAFKKFSCVIKNPLSADELKELKTAIDQLRVEHQEQLKRIRAH